MRLYEVHNHRYFLGAPAYFATLTQAKTKADAAATETRLDTPVNRIEVGTKKDDIVALANRRDWCRSRTLVYTAMRKVGKL